MILREDIWVHDTCLVCQSLHSTVAEKEKHQENAVHKNKSVVYDFLSKELSCLTPSKKPSQLFERYCRANAAIAGLDCICELNFSWSAVPLWACTICYVAGKSLESADEHMHSSFHKRNYISEYHPDRYAKLLRAEEKSSKNKQSLLEHEAILEILYSTKGLIIPDVYEINERDRQWAFQKLGLTEEESSCVYILEEITDTHQIAICNTCNETFIAFVDSEKLQRAWFTHLSTNKHQRCKLMHTLVHEDKLHECKDAPPGCELRTENKFVQLNNVGEQGPYYGPTVGLEYLIMFTDESFCQLCYCCIAKDSIMDHFSCEYHNARVVKKDGPSKLLNSEYLKLQDIHDILTFCFEEKPINTYKYFRSDKQIPILLKNLTFTEQHSIIAYDLEQIDLGHGINAVWCEDCKEYIHMNDPEAWNIHIFDERHFEQIARKSLHCIDEKGLVQSDTKLDDFPRSNKPTWEDQYSVTLGVLTTQDHCEYGLQFIVNDKLAKKLYCTCCFAECEDDDAQMFSFHARSQQHITRAMHSMNKKTMITLDFRFPDINNRKPLILDYLRHFKINVREEHGVSIYDPVLRTRLNCIAIIPKILLNLAKTKPEERRKFLDENAKAADDDNDGLNQFVPFNTALRLCKIKVTTWDKDVIIFFCEECSQTFVAIESEAREHFIDHLLSFSHWERARIFAENTFDENQRLSKPSKVTVPPFQQVNPKKKVTWKWNDKKASYEFVYAQLGLQNIYERRRFKGASKPDMFCTLCAEIFKANRLELEQHIRSFSHIFYYMQMHQQNIIPELQAELLNTELSIVEKHKNIRRLFAKSLKGTENNNNEAIPIYDFNDRECEYKDVKQALIEDINTVDEQQAKQKPPTRQQNVTTICDPFECEDQKQLLDLNAISLYEEQSKRDLKELIKEFSLIIDTNNTIEMPDKQMTKLTLEIAKQQLLHVVHFDGLMETAEVSQATTQKQKDVNVTNRLNSSTAESDRLSKDSENANATNVSQVSIHTPSDNGGDKREQDKRSHRRAQTPVNRSRRRTRSPSNKRKNRSKSKSDYQRHRSPDESPRRQRSRSPLSTSKRARSKSRSRRVSSKERKHVAEKSKHKSRSKSRSTTPPGQRQPIVYTSYAKRLADLKASMLSKGGSKYGLSSDQKIHTFCLTKMHVEKAKVVEYIAKEAFAPTKAPPKTSDPKTSEMAYRPLPKPSYTEKNVGGAYDPSYLEKLYPHLLQKDVSPPRGHLEDLTSERIRQSNVNAMKIQSSQTTRFSRSPSVEKNDNKSRRRDNKRDLEGNDGSGSSDESSSSDSTKQRAYAKQQLLNRLMSEKRKTMAKIKMQIAKDLPAFKQQALRRQFSQTKQNAINSTQKNTLDSIEVGRLQAISPEPDEIAIVSNELDKDTQIAASGSQQILQQHTEQQPQPQAEQQKISRWDLVDGKFVPINQTLTTDESGTASSKIGQQVGNIASPKLITLSAVNQQQAQNVLNQVAASTAALTAKQILGHLGSSSKAETAPMGINIPPPPINQTLTQTASSTPALTTQFSGITTSFPQQLAPGISSNMSTGSSTGTNFTMTTNLLGLSQPATQTLGTLKPIRPILGATPLPHSILGTLTSALGVRPIQTSIPRPQLNKPPPSILSQFHQPSPMVNSTDFHLHSRMQFYANVLAQIDNIAQFIEYMWRESYDPIPITDPPLLFNEILKKRKGLIGADTLYQIICYGHPELETYYCGMCNHWTTASEMFMHLRAPMHQLNYMFRNYKMYHRKAMEESDEEKRDLLLQRFAYKIWEVESCGKCSNRMRLILNEDAMRRIWPDYINCIDHSWKIMDEEDEIEFLDSLTSSKSSAPNAPLTYKQEVREPTSRSAPQNKPASLGSDPNMDISTLSSQVRASIVAKKLELAERAGIQPTGFVELKSEKHRDGDNKRQQQERTDSRSDKSSRKRSRSRARSKRSRTKSPVATKSSRFNRDKERGKEKEDRRSRQRSRSRARESKRSKSREPETPQNNSSLEKEKEKTTGNIAESKGTIKSRDDRELSEQMADFLNRIGDRESAFRMYCQRLEADNEQEENSPHGLTSIPSKPQQLQNAHKVKMNTTISNFMNAANKSLTERLVRGGESILHKQQQNENMDDIRSGASPERPPITEFNHETPPTSAKQANTKAMERQREIDNQKRMKRAIGAAFELQEHKKNSGFLSPEQFFDTCQEFGIQPDEVVKNEILCKAAASFQVDIHSAYPYIMQQAHSKTSTSTASPLSGQIPKMALNQDPQENFGTSIEKQSQEQQPKFNLQSMGVDPSKLKQLDPRMLQNILSKANVNTGMESQQIVQSPSAHLLGRSRLEVQDVHLNEALAPGNYVYPSYEEEIDQKMQYQQRQGRMPSMDIESNINRLTYAFGQNQKQRQRQQDSSAEITLAATASMRNPGQMMTRPDYGGGGYAPPRQEPWSNPRDSSAEFTLAARASMRMTRPPEYGRGYGAPRHEQQILPNQYPRQETPIGAMQQMQSRPERQFGTNIRPVEQQVDFSADVDLIPGKRPRSKMPNTTQHHEMQYHYQQHRPSPPQQQHLQRDATQQLQDQSQRPPQSHNIPYQQHPADALPYFHEQPASTHPSTSSMATQQQLQQAPLPKPTTQMNPNLQRLAMEIGDDWSSLGQFSFDSLIGLGGGSNSNTTKTIGGDPEKKKNA